MVNLNPGDMAPDFEAQDQNGRKVRLADLSGQKRFIYFFPKANTTG